MGIKIKAIVFGLSALLFWGGSVGFVAAEDLLENKENLIEKIEIMEPKADGSFFVSPDYNTDFNFNGAGIEWEGNISKDEVNFYLKVLDNGKWGEWLKLETGEQDAPDFYTKNITDLSLLREGP